MQTGTVVFDTSSPPTCPAAPGAVDFESLLLEILWKERGGKLFLDDDARTKIRSSLLAIGTPGKLMPLE